MFRNYDPAGLETRAMSMGVDINVARKIHESTNLSEVKSLASKIVDDRFENSGVAINVARDRYIAEWKDLLPLFSSIVTETTQSPWTHHEYTCVVSSLFPGLSDWVSNKVSVKFDYNPEYERRILAHEILLSDVFQLMRKRFSKSEVSDWQIWAFSEITPDFILEDPRLQTFWQDFPHGFEYSGYPQIIELEKQLKDLFDNRTSYQDYEDKAAKILAQFQPFTDQSHNRNGWLGVYTGDQKNAEITRQFTMDMQRPDITGVLILGIFMGSPADKGGLMAGDYITAIESTRIESPGQLTQLVRSIPPGGNTNITVLRMGKEFTLPITIGNSNDRALQSENEWPGFLVNDGMIDESEHGINSISSPGVIVTTILDGKAAAIIAGLKLKDRITNINDTAIENLIDFYTAVDLRRNRSMTITVERESKALQIYVQGSMD
jgi:C-terminal processing protease CtpA/Prc